ALREELGDLLLQVAFHASMIMSVIMGPPPFAPVPADVPRAAPGAGRRTAGRRTARGQEPIPPSPRSPPSSRSFSSPSS
ncbi:MazG nucleotide pyrophosphohydrolase domain-containing protein, partial [Streptosporangium sp. NPDC023615]|uniref:MazG nucleotide pyrophosphohydrolase domain-containing protein n=1 Tax=Streptosporangium sp. NPDC023615 TaxID=3154794 RepID=UPI00344318D0